MKRFYVNIEEGNDYVGFQSDADPCIDHSAPVDPSQCTVEQMASALDQDAESTNRHSFVCVHRAVACLIAKRFGREAAHAILADIGKCQGLHAITEPDGPGEEFTGTNLSGWGKWELSKFQP